MGFAYLQAKRNRKLGDMVSWSLPAKNSCPGMTRVCATHCYVNRGTFLYPDVKNRYQQNLENVLSDPNGWFHAVAADLSKLTNGTIIRIHVSGDFFADWYTRLWFTLASDFPTLFFGAYTRSWNRKSILPTLIELSSLHNATIWASVDRDNYNGYIKCGLPLGRAAIMLTPGDDYIVPALLAAGMNRQHIIVFRTSKKEYIKTIGGALVCPIEQNNPTIATHGRQPEHGQIVMDCSRCRLCYDRAIGKRIKV